MRKSRSDSPIKIKDIVGPLIERNPDIVLTGGRYLTLLPVGHVARQIRIHDQPSRGYFRLEWRLTELYIRGKKIDYPGYGRPFGMVGRSSSHKKEKESGLWEWNDPTIVNDFTFQIENEVLKLLRGLDEVQKIINFISSEYYFGYIIHRDAVWMSMTYALLGRMNLALQHWFEITPSYEERYNQIKSRGVCDEQNPYKTYFRFGRALMDQDQQEVAKILLEHERMEAENFKLGRFWQPTHFPFEIPPSP